MSQPNVVEICICDKPTALFDDESGQYFDSDCGGLLKNRSYGSERVIVNLAMLKVGNLSLEIEELSKLLLEKTEELNKAMADWAVILPSEE